MLDFGCHGTRLLLIGRNYAGKGKPLRSPSCLFAFFLADGHDFLFPLAQQRHPVSALTRVIGNLVARNGCGYRFFHVRVPLLTQAVPRRRPQNAVNRGENGNADDHTDQTEEIPADDNREENPERRDANRIAENHRADEIAIQLLDNQDQNQENQRLPRIEEEQNHRAGYRADERAEHGDNVVTTLDVDLQKACYDALGSNRGAVIVMEPSTGKILAMVSKPDFDPNTLAANWSQITGEGSDSVLVNRATQGLYPPGSTFKLITMLEYLREHKNDYGQYHYICDGTYELGHNTINCVRTTAHGDVDLFSSLAVSCNCSFINIGLSLDLDRSKKNAEKMLFNKELPTNLEYNKSRFVLNGESSEWDIAQTSFGQGKTVITPFHLALITCTIANNGTLMKPYLVSSVESTNGMTVKKFKEEKYDTLITEKEASLLKKGMEQVVKDSFSWLFGGVEYTLAAKSGSAQYGTEGYEHSLYASFSPADNPEIAVVAVVEGGPQRNTTAAEVTKQIYDYYYSNK